MIANFVPTSKVLLVQGFDVTMYTKGLDNVSPVMPYLVQQYMYFPLPAVLYVELEIKF